MKKNHRALMVATLATTAVLLAAASVALAAEAGHSSVNWKAEAWKVVNFLIVVGVLWWLLKDRLPAFLGERRNKIDRAIEEAKAAKAEAEAKRTEYEAKIARAEQEIAEIDAEGVRRAEALREDLAKATEEAAEKLAADAKERVEAEVKGARAELQREASLLAVELSEELIRERIAEEDQRKLVDETIQKLEGLK